MSRQPTRGKNQNQSRSQSQNQRRNYNDNVSYNRDRVNYYDNYSDTYSTSSQSKYYRKNESNLITNRNLGNNNIKKNTDDTNSIKDKRIKLPTGPKSMKSDQYDNEDYDNNNNNDNSNYYSKRQYDDTNSKSISNNNYKRQRTGKYVEQEDEEDDEEDVFQKLSSNNNNNNNNNIIENNKDTENIIKNKSNFKYMVKCNITGQIHERIQQVGEGTYGKVYKGRNIITNELVALKKLRLEAEREGFPITSHREIGLLQSFDHKNIVGLYEIMVEKNQVFMVFPYMNHDLSGILQQSNIQINNGEKKNIFNQLLKGIEYLHSKRVIHRDIKGSNILINNEGILKITDFGLARKMKNINENLVSPNYTNRVITLWYRPPEILLGSTNYGREVDIWGIGCILMELFTRRAIFQGINEIDQLWKVYDIMGTIKVNDWPDAYTLPWFEILRPNFKTDFKFKEKFGNLLTPECYNLAINLLQLNPKKRITAKDALNHKYFMEEPKMCSLQFLKNVQGEWHEFEAKQKRKQKQKQLQMQQHMQQVQKQE